MANGTTQTRLKGADLALALCFALALALPLALMAVRRAPLAPAPVANRPSSEAAVQAPAPEAGGHNWGGAMTAFSERANEFRQGFSRRLGGREWLVPLHSRLELGVFRRSPVPEVVKGRDPWLFYAGGNSVAAYRGLRPPNARLWVGFQGWLEARQAEVEQHGGRYLLVIAPDKQAVYPEMMPAELTRLGPTRREQLAAFMKANSRVRVLDLLPALKAAKGQGDLYYWRDTHWNERGALVAWQEITRVLAADFPRFRLEMEADFSMERRPARRYDLATILGMRGGGEELEPHFVPRLAPNVTVFEAATWGGRPLSAGLRGGYWQAPGGELGSVLFNHDSFGEALLPFVRPHFREGAHVHGTLPKLQWPGTSGAGPELVIDELVERLIEPVAYEHSQGR